MLRVDHVSFFALLIAALEVSIYNYIKRWGFLVGLLIGFEVLEV